MSNVNQNKNIDNPFNIEQGKLKNKLGLSMLDSIIGKDTSSEIEEKTSVQENELKSQENLIKKTLAETTIVQDVSQTEIKKPILETPKKILEGTNQVQEPTQDIPKLDIQQLDDISFKGNTNIVSQNKTSNIQSVPIFKGKSLQYLNINDTVIASNNNKLKVLNIAPSFEKIPAYIVGYLNNKYLLKWYSKYNCENLDVLKKYLLALSQDNTVPNYVLKPKMLTQSKDNGCFGCIYENVTDNYFTLGDIINGYSIVYEMEHTPKRKKAKFKNMNTLITSAINICKVFKSLNNDKKYLHCFYDEDLLINLDNGNVLLDISYSTNHEDKPVILDDTCTYLPPEILNNENPPNVDSNNHILAVILFRLLFHDHPLEGKSVIDDPSLDPKEIAKHYGDDAQFIFHPEDTSNRPIRGVHYAVISMWNKYPDYIKEEFSNSFIDYLFCPEERNYPDKWLEILLHMKSDILSCVCGRTDFSFLYEFTPEAFYKCQNCGSKYHSIYFHKKKFSIPIFDGNVIYTCFLKDNVHTYDEIMGIVIENKIHANLFGLKNVSKIPWSCSLSNGDMKVVNNSDVLPIFEKNVIDYFGSMAEFDFYPK